MGILEDNNKKRVRKTRMQKIILDTVVTAGMLSVALVAPNVIGAMDQLGILPKRRQKEYVSSTAAKMVKKGLLKFNGKFYEPTQEGRNIFRLWQLDNYRLKKPGKWDKKWRIIVYDIAEKKGKTRRQISDLFKHIGLYRLQDSIWIYPYDCEDIMALLKTDASVGKDMLYIIADEIENDKHLRNYFDLT